MFEPQNEQGVIVLFAQECHRFDMKIVSIQTEYPDAIVEWRGRNIFVEFEYQSSNFYKHGHDPRACDLIVCWNDDYAGAVPVVALKYENWLIDDNFRFASPAEKEIEYWRDRALAAERELVRLETKLASSEDALSVSSASDWRYLSDETKLLIADMSTRELVEKYKISPRTARDWRKRALEMIEELN